METLPEKTIDQLVRAASAARAFAYAPYSKFRVGAALLCPDGRMITGCNVENVSYGLTVCAERTAVLKAVSEGARSFDAVAVCADTDEPVTPCGACRQVLAEFNPAMTVICCTPSGTNIVYSLSELLPNAFNLKK
ncbi:cytidine deaminase [bacterium]|nr:cytidine deaminase [bacterium]